jgi:tripartite-type tricarboxylate transporter receptor subunit TctC
MRRFPLYAALLCCAAVFDVQAQTAADTIKVIVPFSAGGPTDTIARTISDDLGKALGKTVIVENRGGAGGVIGVGTAAKSPADGSTLLLTTSSLVITAGTTPKLSYDPRKDVVPVYLLGEVQTMLAVRPSLGVKTLAELVAKAKEGNLKYGSTGVGGTMHIGAELLSKATGAKMLHVPYRGAAPALMALMSDTVDLVNADVPVLQPYIKSGKLQGIVIYDTRHSPQLPDIPTATEAGLPELQMTNWYGVFVPAGTPADVRKKIETALDKVVHKPEIAAKLAAAGFSNPKNAAGFKARLDADFDRWLPWLKQANITTD